MQSSSAPTILVTGATGQLGQLVVAGLLKTQPAASLIVTGRTAESLEQFAAQGMQTRIADYAKPETLEQAFRGADRLLLVSSSEVGQREPQHRNVVTAARLSGVKFIAYTSILRADDTELELAAEHLATEQFIRRSGIPFTFLRNGWYLENYTNAVQQGLSSGSFAGASREGRVSAATRADFAAAAVAVLTATSVDAAAIYELAGDEGFTMQELATQLSSLSGNPVAFTSLTEKDYHELLRGFGLPDAVAHIYSQSDAGASHGALFDDSRALSRLIGRPTTTVEQWLATMQIMATS